MKTLQLLAFVLATAAPTMAALDWTPDSTTDSAGGLTDLIVGAGEWNGNYGHAALITGGQYLGIIRTEEERNRAVAAMLALDYAASGDFTNPASVEVFDVSENPRVSREAYFRWAASADSAACIGQEAYLVDWQIPGVGPFQTIALVTDQTVAWEGILQSAAYEEPDTPGTLAAGRSSMSRRIKWIWGSTRGRISAKVQAICNGPRISCQKTCDAWMSVGTAIIKCEIEKAGECCNLKYSFGWGTPLVDVEVARDGFSVTASGLGSNGEGNGTLIDCCD